MSAHDAEHEDRIVELVWGERPEDVAAIASMASTCDECLAYLYQLAEDVAALGGKNDRLTRAIDETMAWLAMRDDARAPEPAPVGGGARRKA